MNRRSELVGRENLVHLQQHPRVIDLAELAELWRGTHCQGVYLTPVSCNGVAACTPAWLSLMGHACIVSRHESDDTTTTTHQALVDALQHVELAGVHAEFVASVN